MRPLRQKASRRIGLQTKSLLAFTAMVAAAVGAGSWLYCAATSQTLRQHDRQQADRLASGLAVAAADDLQNNNRDTIQRLLNELLNHPNVHLVCIVDRDRRVLARAERFVSGAPPIDPAARPASLSYETELGADFLVVGRPIVVFDGSEGLDTLIGAVRLVMDTRTTAKIIAGTQKQIAMIAATIVLCAVPLAYLLVWRVVVLPIRRLVTATGRLADGDFSVRTDIAGNDELAELAGSFDAMAEKLHASQQALRRANESLEVKVAQRTAELKRANRRLRGEMTEKEEFLRAVSHDLNAPLRNIAGMATMILMKWRDDLPEEVLARLQRIQANIQIETDLLGELLEISRIRSRPQKREWVELGALLAEVRGAFEYELKQRSIALDIDCGMPALHVERNRIRELFQNLIDNAIKYMSPRPDGRIRVGYQLADGMHRFWVADNGPGVAPEERERIFTVFRRAANAAQTGVPGKGVGLAVVRTIVGNYDGRVWVESNSPEGAVFFVELSAGNTRGPVAEADREHSEIPAASAAD